MTSNKDKQNQNAARALRTYICIIQSEKKNFRSPAMQVDMIHKTKYSYTSIYQHRIHHIHVLTAHSPIP